MIRYEEALMFMLTKDASTLHGDKRTDQMTYPGREWTRGRLEHANVLERGVRWYDSERTMEAWNGWKVWIVFNINGRATSELRGKTCPATLERIETVSSVRA
jgi:hypothetical protein